MAGSPSETSDFVRFEATIGADQMIRPPTGVVLPEGTVEVTVRALAEQPEKHADPLAETRQWLLALALEAERAAPNLPSDMAERHDFYAHGKPLP